MKMLLLLFIICLSACNHHTYPKFDYNRSSSPWKDAFKDRVFFEALKEAYKSEPLIFQSIEKRDALNPYDGLSLEALQKAQEIGAALIRNLPPPRMCEGCKNGVNYYMASALHYYNSRELEQIASKLLAAAEAAHYKVFKEKIRL